MKKTMITSVMALLVVSVFAHPGHPNKPKHGGHGNHSSHHGNHNSHNNGCHNGHYAGYTHSGYGNHYTRPNIITGYHVMTYRELDRVLLSMDRTAFDDNRLRIAKQAVRYNRVTSNQVLAMMEMLSFESSRLRLAKFAYRYVVDPRNYYVVNDGFTFSSSVRDLNQYIAHY